MQKLAKALGLQLARVQFTPDLMPGYITGTEILEEDHTNGKRILRFVCGPVFANIVLADEINRTLPKTHAALFQAMQEHKVTAASQTTKLPKRFFFLDAERDRTGRHVLPPRYGSTDSYSNCASAIRRVPKKSRSYGDERRKRRGTSGARLRAVERATASRAPIGGDVARAVLRRVGMLYAAGLRGGDGRREVCQPDVVVRRNIWSWCEGSWHRRPHDDRHR